MLCRIIFNESFTLATFFVTFKQIKFLVQITKLDIGFRSNHPHVFKYLIYFIFFMLTFFVVPPYSRLAHKKLESGIGDIIPFYIGQQG